jgi:hypothetical protein
VYFFMDPYQRPSEILTRILGITPLNLRM